MIKKSLCVVSCLVLAIYTAAAAAQDSSEVVIPEKTMAARLVNYPTPALQQPALLGRCSNALAVLHVFVDAGGSVSNVDYKSGFSELKEPAISAVKHWTYKPYVSDGKPIRVETQVSIFYLGDGSSLPMYIPDGKGGVKGGNMLPLPPGCGPGPQIKRPH